MARDLPRIPLPPSPRRARGRGVLAGLLPVLLTCGALAAQEKPAPGPATPVPLLDGEAVLGRWIALTAETTLGAGVKPDAYEWHQEEGPAPWNFGTQTSQVRVWLLLERAGKYRFSVRAHGAHDWGAPAPLEFSVPEGRPALPLAEALAPTGAGELVVLSGEAWRQLNGPPAGLRESPDGRETTFRPLATGLYLFEALRAGDLPERRALWVPPGRDETMGDRRPIAMLPLALQGRAGEPVTLDASLSNDPDGPSEKLQARWSADLVHGATLTRQPGLKAVFTAHREGVYRVTLVVSDGQLDSRPAERLVQIAPQAGAAEETEPARPGDDPLERRVTLRLYESNLDWAVQKFPSLCGLALRVDRSVAAPEQYTRTPLQGLGVQNASVRLLSDWIARQTGGCYRFEPNGSLWLTTPTAWAREEKLVSLALSADALHDAADGSDLMALLQPCLRGVLGARSDATLTYQPAKEQVVAVLPATVAARVREVLLQLRAPKGLGLPFPAGRSPDEQRFRRLLARTPVTLDARLRRLDFLLRDLAEAGGLAVGFDPRQFPEGLPKVTLKLAEVPLREAAREITAAAGFDGCQPAEGDGLWFYRGGEPNPSGEVLWEAAFARSYDLETVLARVPLLSGEAIAHQIRKRIFPGSWATPGAYCGYHAPTGKLLVLHHAAAQERVLTFLWDLLVRGEWALGPVLTAP